MATDKLEQLLDEQTELLWQHIRLQTIDLLNPWLNERILRATLVRLVAPLAREVAQQWQVEQLQEMQAEKATLLEACKEERKKLKALQNDFKETEKKYTQLKTRTTKQREYQQRHRQKIKSHPHQRA